MHRKPVSKKRKKEGKPASALKEGGGLGLDVERKFSYSNIRYTHLRVGITDHIRNRCCGTRN